MEAILDVTGAGKRKRGRGGSVPSPKERRTLWQATPTTSSYPPNPYRHRFLQSIVFVYEHCVKTCRRRSARAAGRRNGGNPLAKWRNPLYWEGHSSCLNRCRTTPRNGIQSKPDSAPCFRSTDSRQPLSPLARNRRPGPMRNGSPVRREDAG